MTAFNLAKDVVSRRTKTYLKRCKHNSFSSLTCSTIISRGTRIGRRCEIPSIAVHSGITILTLFLLIQAKPVAVGSCRAWFPVHANTSWAVEPSRANIVSFWLILSELQWKAIVALRTRLAATSLWDVRKIAGNTWLGCGTALGAMETNGTFLGIFYNGAFWTEVTCLARTGRVTKAFGPTIISCRKYIWFHHYFETLLHQCHRNSCYKHHYHRHCKIQIYKYE